MSDDERTSGLLPFVLSAFLEDRAGNREPVEIQVAPPVATEFNSFQCEIRSSMLQKNPHHVYSGLSHDAWANAFQAISSWLEADGKQLVDRHGRAVVLPSPPRDRSWIPPRKHPDVTGLTPLYRMEGWAHPKDGPRQRVELAVWPAFEEEPGVFCAPIRSGLRQGGKVICSYGASAEQAVFLAYKFLRTEVEHSRVQDDAGALIDIPIPPEPTPIPPP